MQRSQEDNRKCADSKLKCTTEEFFQFLLQKNRNPCALKRIGKVNNQMPSLIRDYKYLVASKFPYCIIGQLWSDMQCIGLNMFLVSTNMPHFDFSPYRKNLSVISGKQIFFLSSLLWSGPCNIQFILNQSLQYVDYIVFSP